MHFLSICRILILGVLITACASTPELTPKGADLNTLDAQANYLTTKNVCKKITGKNALLSHKAFLLGAFDVRDGIASRVPEASYDKLIETLRNNASPLASVAEITDEDSAAFPNGLRTVEERFSYLAAYAIAKSFGKKGIPVLPASMALGLADTQTQDTPKISSEEEKIIINAIKEKMLLTDDQWAENRKHYYITEEKRFFAANITQPNVVSLDSGVQYILLKKGAGKIPKSNDSVTLHYKGSLLDGSEFDSSYKRNSADTFKLSAMVPGFTQAVSQVPAGSKILIYIPSALAYGEKGVEKIPPYAAVVFEVELLSIKSGLFH